MNILIFPPFSVLHFAGVIPDSFGRITNLNLLDLSANMLTGDRMKMVRPVQPLRSALFHFNYYLFDRHNSRFVWEPCEIAGTGTGQ